MATFFKYVIGALILGAFIAFLINSIKSFVVSIREARDKKKSPGKVSTEPTEKVETDDGKGGVSE